MKTYAFHIVLDGRARMVAHEITDAPFLFAVMVRRRTFLEKESFDCTFHVVAERLANRRIQGGAMSRGGSFDQSGAGLELYVEWRRRRELVLSNTDLNQEA